MTGHNATLYRLEEKVTVQDGVLHRHAEVKEIKLVGHGAVLQGRYHRRQRSQDQVQGTDAVQDRHRQRQGGGLVTIRSQCSPDANGRQPLKGEQKWTITFIAESGEKVYVEFGDKGYENFRKMINQIDEDDKTGTHPGRN